MELQANRERFVDELKPILDSVKFNDKFWIELQKHQKNIYLKSLNKFKDNDLAQKVFIFLEFTRERSTCEKLIEILRDSGLEEAANKLSQFNKSEGLMEISYETNLQVRITRHEWKGTELYEMNKRVRGKCVIFNNIMTLCRESFRFENIFKQLNFEVMLYFQLTTEEIEKRLQSLADDSSLSKSNALIVMIISHGSDERIIGFDRRQNNDNPDDLKKISDIVNIFSEEKCKNLYGKPKLFFFTCCRIKQASTLVSLQLSQPTHPVGMNVWPPTSYKLIDIWPKNSEEINYMGSNDKIQLEFKTVDTTFINKNKDTFVCYSCAEGEFTYLDRGYTYFGQALSHSIAQFACEKSLQIIMSRTKVLMEKLKNSVIDDSEMTDENLSTPEIRLLGLRRQLYFNPGIESQ